MFIVIGWTGWNTWCMCRPTAVYHSFISALISVQVQGQPAGQAIGAVPYTHYLQLTCFSLLHSIHRLQTPSTGISKSRWHNWQTSWRDNAAFVLMDISLLVASTTAHWYNHGDEWLEAFVSRWQLINCWRRIIWGWMLPNRHWFRWRWVQSVSRW